MIILTADSMSIDINKNNRKYSKIMTENISICRACLNNSGLISIFSNKDNFLIADLMMEFVKIKIYIDEPLPSLLCERCCKKIYDFHRFKIMCQVSDNMLRNRPSENIGFPISPNIMHSNMDIGCSASDSNMFERDQPNGKNNALENKIKNSCLSTKLKKDKEKLSKLKIKTSSNILEMSTIDRSNNEIFVNINNEKCKEKSETKCLNNISKKAVRKRQVVKTINFSLSDVDNIENTNESIGSTNETEITAISSFRTKKGKKNKKQKDRKVSESKEKSIQDLYYYDNFDLEFKPKQKQKRRLSKHVCKQCGKVENDRTNLRIHIRVHTGERPYPCHLCPKRFVVPSTLRGHIRTHTGETPYVCDVCGRCFASSTYFYAHQRTHTGERPYKCTRCPKTFTFSSNLKGHLRRHTGDKPYTCQVCSKSFTYKTDLNGHLRMHTGEKPFACNLCPKAFSQRGNLKIHLLTHSGERNFRCDKCDKAFISKGSLGRHNRIHTGEKRFECSLCKKKFAHSNTLAAHKIMHTGTRDYHCLHCDKKYARLSSLIAHKKKHEHLEGDMKTKETTNNVNVLDK